MNAPGMILFDYGQTLICEEPFDSRRGFEALLEVTVQNDAGVDAAGLHALEQRMRQGLGHNDPNARVVLPYEVHFINELRYIKEYFGLGFSVDDHWAEELFWDAAAPPLAAPGAAQMLDGLGRRGVRTAVVSNLSFTTATLAARLNRLLPGNRFEFIMTSSEYVFRKPSPLVFELALKKTGLPAGEVWFCGDNAVCDIVGAGKAGMAPVWYSGKDTPDCLADEADFEYHHIRHWDELLDLIDN